MFSTGSSSSSGDSSGDNKLRGAEQIREHLQQLNRDARSREHMRSDDQVRTKTWALLGLGLASKAAMQDPAAMRQHFAMQHWTAANARMAACGRWQQRCSVLGNVGAAMLLGALLAVGVNIPHCCNVARVAVTC
jgi:hypothetical protein